MDVRTNGDSGKLLFTWNPEESTVDIVKRGMFYKVKLLYDLKNPFSIVDHHPQQMEHEKEAHNPEGPTI